MRNEAGRKGHVCVPHKQCVSHPGAFAHIAPPPTMPFPPPPSGKPHQCFQGLLSLNLTHLPSCPNMTICCPFPRPHLEIDLSPCVIACCGMEKTWAGESDHSWPKAQLSHHWPGTPENMAETSSTSVPLICRMGNQGWRIPLRVMHEESAPGETRKGGEAEQGQEGAGMGVTSCGGGSSTRAPGRGWGSHLGGAWPRKAAGLSPSHMHQAPPKHRLPHPASLTRGDVFVRGASHYERGLLGIFGPTGASKAAPGTHSRVSSERGVAVQVFEAKPQHGQGRGAQTLQGTRRIRLHPLHHPPGITAQSPRPWGSGGEL